MKRRWKIDNRQQKIDNRQQKQDEIDYAADWLRLSPDRINARIEYLSLTQKYGTNERKRKVIDATAEWLKNHDDDTAVRVRYLTLTQKYGTSEQKKEAIDATAEWLKNHDDDTAVRVKYLALVGRESELVENIEFIIDKQWQWIEKQDIAEKSSLATFLSVVSHHAKDNIKLIKQAFQLALKQYPKDLTIARAVFDFQDYLEFEVCHELADLIANFNLPKNKWHYAIPAANFFRDYDELNRAEMIYTKVIKSENKYKKKIKASFASLEYARFLIIKEPSKWNKAVKYLETILKEDPAHCLANFYMAQCYQAKALSNNNPTNESFELAIEFYRKAIQYDIHKNGKYWYEFGNFYKQIMGNKAEAYKCFRNSLEQKDNLPACIALAELELEAGNKNDAREYIERGLKIELITRPEREEKEQLMPKIQSFQQQLD